MELESQCPLVYRLESLLEQLKTQQQPIPEIEAELLFVLDNLATVLKDGKTGLPDTICGLLRLLSSSNNIVEPDAALKQIGRVAANMVVQNDFNRNALCALGYVDAVLSPATLGRGPRSCDHALVAGLYNMVVEGNVLQRSIDNNALESASVLDQDTLSRLMTPIQCLVSPMWSIDDSHQQQVILETLSLSCRLIEKILSCSSSAFQSLFLPKRRLDIILDFIEHANPPSQPLADRKSACADESDEDEELDPEQSMGESKAYLVFGVVSASSEVQNAPEAAAFWERLGRWTASDIEKRKDLVECALLGLGNSVKDDASALKILNGDIFPFDRITKLLRPQTPGTTQHALVGLLRNLSISAQGQKRLSTLGVADKLVDMGVWTSEKDMLGSVQGGTIGVFKNLCKSNPATASHLIAPHKDQLLDLIHRTDDQAIILEGTRVFVNAARNLPKGLDSAGVHALQDPRIAELMVDMLFAASEHPILQGEAVLGLALLAVFGKAKSEVSKSMNVTRPGDPGMTGEQLLREILRNGKDNMSEEIRQNGETLMSVLQGSTDAIE
ncbi:hypothetical protein IAR50_007142 [Cryptococcus sp. DSM 104548]